MSRRTGIILGIILVFFGLVAWWFFANFSLVPTTIPRGPTLIALEDPYLAAHRLADKLGVPSKGAPTIAGMPPDDFAVFLGGDRGAFVGKRQDDLVAWVERGGHLLIVLPEPDDSQQWQNASEKLNDALLDRLGIVAYPIVNGSPETIDAPLPVSDRRSEVEFQRPGSLQPFDDPIYEILDGNDNRMLVTIRRGAGWVTAMVDDDWLTNDHIGENQHATLFWELLKQSNPAGFWAVRGDRVPSFLKLLVQHGWPALLAFALLVVLWIRRASLRFGPLLTFGEEPRRSLIEHLDAAGRFLWRCQAHDVLLRPMRDRLVREIGRRRPGWARISDSQKITRLAELSNLSPEEVENALTVEEIPDTRTFVRTVRDIQQLEANL